MFSFSNVVHLFAYKFPCLCRRRFALPGILSCALDCFLFWHIKNISLENSPVDVHVTQANVIFGREIKVWGSLTPTGRHAFLFGLDCTKIECAAKRIVAGPSRSTRDGR